MATIELTKDNFEQTINSNPIVILDFWAPWCGPCRGFAPVFEKASEAHPDVVFAKVNSDEQQELAGAFNIRSIPTLMVFREKVILFQQAGALPGQALEQVLTQAKSLDMAKVHAEIAAQNATIQRRPWTTGKTLLSAASTTEVAIADSTSREGSEITPSAARLSVIECATVNEVTILNTSQNAGGNRATARQRPPSSTSTAGRSSESRNRMWSKPIQMCHTPSRA